MVAKKGEFEAVEMAPSSDDWMDAAKVDTKDLRLVVLMVVDMAE
jgi:hypothetical protein